MLSANGGALFVRQTHQTIYAMAKPAITCDTAAICLVVVAQRTCIRLLLNVILLLTACTCETTEGDYRKVLYGLDSLGNLCGTENGGDSDVEGALDLTGKPMLHYVEGWAVRHE